MNNQLQLTILRVKELGFAGRNIENKRVYEAKALNSVVYYNPEEPIYTWYYKTQIGKKTNHINLKIETEADLLSFLKIIRAE